VGFRPDLDLSGILPDYREHMSESTAGVNFVDGKRKADPFEDQEAIPKRLYAPERSAMVDDPWRVGNGPATCSTRRTATSTRPLYAWDVNGYYRELGIPWPYVDATRGVLRKAFYAVNGHESARLTYCFKQLLNPAVRAEYDEWPLGEEYLHDEYVQDAIKKRAAFEASKRTQDGTYTHAETILDEWGFIMKYDEVLGDRFDTSSGKGQDDPGQSFDPIEWVYSYWLWKSFGTDVARLQTWQTLLVSELANRDEQIDLAVGSVGKVPHDYVIGFVDNEFWVVFLNNKVEPDPVIAATAVSALLKDINNTPHTPKQLAQKADQ
jgi:hypothetical protein